jgi:excisionase family DNA binding protein
MPDELSTKDAAALLTTTVPTVLGLIEDGELTGRKEPRGQRFRWRISRASVEASVKEHGTFPRQTDGRTSRLSRVEREIVALRTQIEDLAEARGPDRRPVGRERDDLRARVVALTDALARTRSAADMRDRAEEERADGAAPRRGYRRGRARRRSGQGGLPQWLATALLGRPAPSAPRPAAPGLYSRSVVVPGSPFPARWRLGDLPDWPAEPFPSSDGLGSVETMIAPMSTPQAQDSHGEQVRKQRLWADGQRSPAVNLRETISLTRKLFELRDAARRAR